MTLQRASRPVAQCIRQSSSTLHARTLATTTIEPSSTDAAPPPPSDPFSHTRNPFTASTPAAEKQLAQQKQRPVGSRRRRAALSSTTQIPFTQLPYQAFQEARAFLQEDRREKLEAIGLQRVKLVRLQDQVVVGEQDGEVERRKQREKDNRVRSMGRRLEEMKVMADINDPMVKKKFEDGQGDMTKPIYRHLADAQWRSYKRQILVQRLTQMNVIPDVLPALEPIVSTGLAFPTTSSTTPARSRLKRVQHGDFVSSTLSSQPPTLWIQPYNKGTRLCTVAVVNPDVPNVEKDGFDHRCHFLAVNIPISPINTRVRLGELGSTSENKGDVLLPWLPAYAQKGAPYQRMSIIVLEQPSPTLTPILTTLLGAVAESQELDAESASQDPRYNVRDGFNLRSFVDRYGLKAVGADLFRTKWDEGTAGVMQQAGIVGWDVEFRRKRVEPLPYQRKASERYR
ncbi:mitochondrial 54S ribosomal protein YmL35 [Friedmanniomyces endolithicus]|uniref:Large ribosomal subunit protein mL38 n=1 Tax=Friedmanniomyces endolithicus TaxID=329885 RepID=A0AAN6KIY4_9PEZI|nr:mitochondrial 54S ribosomal protein YmL35 [Friedmanniomyces endolithicus]KAK0780413.1 mitochondrial 54S ribosomal protein YmL35 [Friedmanniomyces endolithicus]KAK0792287.1 mitochondrial 54S ribosomal protein YmL35 [Friedmanniomyces endolithicus]KAK0804476.1 mitochondrial 54S ribosomal protein YmL35 [Friedmanniomyces endolithicus]KAK0846390.1 mitochondrial 54S ribosomal protein YmL35 [Friedmanniomyces endolithicus]